MFLAGLLQVIVPGSPQQTISGSGHPMQNIRSTLYRHLLRNVTQDVFSSWFLIFVLTIRSLCNEVVTPICQGILEE